MTRLKNIIDFQRRHRIEKSPEARARPGRPRKKAHHMWGPLYWPFGFRTWMFLTGIVPVTALLALWCFGWREPFEEFGPITDWFFTSED